MRAISFLVIVLILLSVPALAIYKDTQTLSLDASKIERLRINCGAGYLEIKGVEGLKTIEVEARIVIKGIDDEDIDEFIDDYMDLELEDKGNYAKLTSHFDYDGGGFFRRIATRALIDLTIQVPIEMELDIEDGSGLIAIQKVNGDVDIEDGSGEIGLFDIGGNIRINDGSGEIEMEDITGDIDLDDGSGDIRINVVTGDIEIDDGSGDIRVRRVDGSVTVSDGSGDIRIDDVTQDVDVEDDSSGSRHITNVEGKVYR
ncbi:MAG: DUF4097 family beta strand repeat-containing protein [candidate division Zixibacteria bacterium]